MMECTKCKETDLDEKDFYPNRRGGLMRHCKECHKKMVNKHRPTTNDTEAKEAARHRAREHQRKKYWSDPEKYRAAARERYHRKKEEKSVSL